MISQILCATIALSGLDKVWHEANWVSFRKPPVVETGRCRLTYRLAAGDRAKNLHLTITDAQGEVFTYSSVSSKTADGVTEAVYVIAEGTQIGAMRNGRPCADSTRGKNKNQKLDPPLRLTAVVMNRTGMADAMRQPCELISLEPEATGIPNVTCRRKVRLEPDRDTFRGVKCEVGYEPDGKLHVTPKPDARNFSIHYNNFPGMRPFSGAKEIVVRTSCATNGTAAIFLKNLSSGEVVKSSLPWSTEMHFTLDLPPTGLWNIQNLGIWLKNPPAPGFTLDSIELVSVETEAGAFALDVDTGTKLYSVVEGQKPVVTLTNRGDRGLSLTGQVQLRDFHAKGPDIPVQATVKAGETLRLEIPGALKKGIWRVEAKIASGDSQAVLATTFAVLDRHVITPRLKLGACFRPGINYHADRFSPVDRELTMDALAACGCKLVRAGGFNFGRVERAEGVFDWAISDAIMAAAEKRGISINAGIYSPPPWSQDAERRKSIKHRKAGSCPPREGVYGRFVEKLAARYGTKIDYYEIGNEWDLFPIEVMTPDEAIRLVREGATAVKRGCPDAKVMPCGWTYPSSLQNSPRAGHQVGFQETVMKATKDLLDFYPNHMHGPFAQYRLRVPIFFEMRKHCGLDGLPWYANETALSTVNGMEDEAALTVYKKILFAWAHGSVDYIWYNLKATGWVPTDSEQAYGLLTADFHPRATYAAYSALVKIYLGLAFDRTLVEERTRLAYGFRGERKGHPTIVFGGWDEALATVPRTIPVKTDAKRAASADLMGNLTLLPVRNGRVDWPISAEPSSLILVDATVATPDERALHDIPLPENFVCTLKRGQQEPAFVLDTQGAVHETHQAIPELRDRLWKGRDDHSAKVWLDHDGEKVHVRVEVTDDVWAKGDGVEVTVTPRSPVGRESSNRRIVERLNDSTNQTINRRIDESTNRRIFEGTLPAPTEFFFAIRVLEDDGEGEDGWLRLGDDFEPERLVRFETPTVGS